MEISCESFDFCCLIKFFVKLSEVVTITEFFLYHLGAIYVMCLERVSSYLRFHFTHILCKESYIMHNLSEMYCICNLLLVIIMTDLI